MREHNQLSTAPNPLAKRFNVIFIFIDAVRADHLSVYGYSRDTSPNLSKLGERACVFENAFAPSPYTFESMPKFMKSCYWDANTKTWTEILAENGYNTILFPRRTQTMLRYVKGMANVVKDGTKGLRQTIDTTINVLGNEPMDRPFGAFVYISDPHMPYNKHQEFNFGSSVADLYDGELAYTDFHLGRLFDWLEQSGRLNDTIVVVMADHGESLGERAVYKHSTQLYNEQARVPMIVHVPGIARRHIPDYVSTIDLGSTILNAVGINCPKEYTGASLLPLMRGESFTHLPIYGEQTMTEDSRYIPLDRYVYPDTKKYMVVTQDGFKLIYNRDAFCFELFNLKEDPREEHNLYDRMPEKAGEMKKLVGRFVDVVTVSRPSDADEKKYDFGLKKKHEQ
jgi:arylsulfatase A-like enzyme